jgi:hypothetical protein
MITAHKTDNTPVRDSVRSSYHSSGKGRSSALHFTAFQNHAMFIYGVMHSQTSYQVLGGPTRPMLRYEQYYQTGTFSVPTPSQVQCSETGW